MANRCVNKVILIGNLTRDPELRYTPEGVAVCTFGVATNRSWLTSDGQKKEEVQYHRIVAWQKLAELCAKLLVKGKKVYLEGRITYRTYTGKDNQEKSITEIVLDDFVSFDNRSKKEETAVEGEIKENLELKTQIEDNKQEKKEAKNDLSEENLNTDSSTNQEDVNPEDIPF